MKKQELIKHIEDLPYKEGPIVDKIDISRKGLLELVEQLDEPGKVKIPSVVARWIGYAKGWNKGLHYALSNASDEVLEWLCVDKLKRQEIFARAWLDGYEVEETKYVVTDGNHLYFKGYQEDVDIVILADEQPGTMDYVKKFDTKEKAQEVANILGWKVQEVE